MPERRPGSLAATAVATGFGSGLIRPGPGTWGSIAAGLIAYPLILWLPAVWLWPTLIVLVGVACLGCLWSAPIVARQLGVHDPGRVVIDEMAGVWAGLAVIPAGVIQGRPLLAVVLVVILFRCLDIAKPWPVCGVERWPGAWGVLADDVVAGIVAGLASLPLIL